MTIADLQKKYELSKDDFWEHQQSRKWILTHDAVEKIAHKEKITLVNIQVLNSEEDLVRFLITMSKSDFTITSVGEADRKNCRTQYLGCLAEKRGIDRCVLKLINAYEYGISSEVEADDFAKPTFYPKRENHLEMFDTLLKDSYFDGQRSDVKDKWKVLNSLTETDQFLRQMKQRIKSNGEVEHENN